MTHIHSVMIYHHGNKLHQKSYFTFNARVHKEIRDPKDPSQQQDPSWGNLDQVTNCSKTAH